MILFDSLRWELFCWKRAWGHHSNKCCIPGQNEYSLLGIYSELCCNLSSNLHRGCNCCSLVITISCKLGILIMTSTTAFGLIRWTELGSPYTNCVYLVEILYIQSIWLSPYLLGTIVCSSFFFSPENFNQYLLFL
jgi:hypothetical protein